jgi:hypothetical protein
MKAYVLSLSLLVSLSAADDIEGTCASFNYSTADDIEGTCASFNAQLFGRGVVVEHLARYLDSRSLGPARPSGRWDIIAIIFTHHYIPRPTKTLGTVPIGDRN